MTTSSPVWHPFTQHAVQPDATLIAKGALRINAPLKMPNERPSGLALLCKYLAAINVPAPVMFSTIMAGLPGICFPMWRAMARV